MKDVSNEQSPASLLAQSRYAEAAAAYEQAIASDPTDAANYWHLGLALLLQGQETEAQFAWMTPLMEAEPEQAEQWTAELLQVLQGEADRQEALSDYDVAWLLHQHMQEIAPDQAGLLKLVAVGLKAGTLNLQSGLERAIAVLQQGNDLPVETVLSLVQAILACDNQHPQVYEFLAASVPYFGAGLPDLVQVIMAQAYQCHKMSHYAAAIELSKFCLQLVPEDSAVMAKTVFFLQSGNTVDLKDSLPLAQRLLQSSSNLVEQITFSQYVLTSLMMTGGSSQETREYYQNYKRLLRSIDSDHSSQSNEQIHQVMAMGMFLNYFEDDPATNRPIRNQVAEVCQTELRSLLSNHVDQYRQHQAQRTQRKLPKIGYLSDCLRLHSVGWLVRWLLAHHDRDRFDIHLYSTRQSDDPLQQVFKNAYGDRFHSVPFAAAEIADRIDQDGIDILVELDSLTAFSSCAVSALKPAPVQATWLGYDASGLPAIDYYIADPYVLPDNAQADYTEKIWRLPQTYVAVDGFEVGTPSLRRDQLGIPGDAIVYLSSQTGLKRNADNIRLQLKILKAVPNSYFLIKSFYADRALLAEFFHRLADIEGVERDRLCFLPDVPANETHRANLGLADVVLDTYPYNGATTTLEALWMELPIVTRVGEQFAARNSYSFMVNAGIAEGIAWSDDEYLEWGIRLGQDAALRSQIAHRLRRSRQTAPLWNARAFARNLEQSYQQWYSSKRSD